MANASTLISDIKSRLAISTVVKDAVELRGNGPSLVGLCPFHQEKTPSFNVRDNIGRFKCFGCGVSGDVFEFIMRLRGITFKEAAGELAERAGLKNNAELKGLTQSLVPKSDDLIRAQQVAQEYFLQELNSKSGLLAMNYLLKDRGLLGEMIKQAGIGFAGNSDEKFLTFLKQKNISEERAVEAGLIKMGRFSYNASFLNRITFPIKRFAGQIVAFGGRKFLGDDLASPKYVNTHAYVHYEKRNTFYGLFESKPAILKGLAPVLVEGYFDALAMWAAGVPALALCGTALSQDHTKILKKLGSNIILCFDTDAAGLNALRSSLTLLLSNQFNVRVVAIQKSDPGQYLCDHEIAKLKVLVSEARDALIFIIDQASLLARKNIDARIQEIEQLIPILGSIQRPIIRRQYVTHLARRLNEDPSILWGEIEGVSKKLLIKSAPNARPVNIKITSKERFVLQALRLSPALVAEITDEILLEMSDPIAEIISGFTAFAQQPEYSQSKGLIYYLENIDPDLAQNIKAQIFSEIPFSEAELHEVLLALHAQALRNVTKKNLQKKRAELQKAEVTNDFEAVLRSLREQSQILALSKPVSLKTPKIVEKSKADIIIEKKWPISPVVVLPEDEDWL